jgi:frataxin-like iron-binding protein CyaY
MDTKEFLLVAGELFADIERVLDASSVDGIDTQCESASTQLLLPHEQRISLEADAAALALRASDGGVNARFTYHEIEEQWFETATQVTLARWLEARISDRMGMAVPLHELGQ